MIDIFLFQCCIHYHSGFFNVLKIIRVSGSAFNFTIFVNFVFGEGVVHLNEQHQRRTRYDQMFPMMKRQKINFFQFSSSHNAFTYVDWSMMVILLTMLSNLWMLSNHSWLRWCLSLTFASDLVYTSNIDRSNILLEVERRQTQHFSLHFMVSAHAICLLVTIHCTHFTL